MKTYYKIFLLFGFLFFSSQAEAGYCYSLGDGDFEDTLTWSCNRIPGSGDTILVSVGDTVTVNNPITGLTGVWLQVYGCMDFKNAARVVFEYGDTAIPPSMVTFYTGSSCINGNGSSGLSFGSGGSGCDVYRPAQGANLGVYPTIPGSYYDGCVWASYLPVKDLEVSVEVIGDQIYFDWSLDEPMEIKAYEILGISDQDITSVISLDARNNNNYEYYNQQVSIENYEVFVLYAIQTDESKLQLTTADVTHLLANSQYVSPNPFYDKLVVGDREEFEVQLVGMDGKVHFQYSGSNFYTLSTSDLDPGVYYLITMKDGEFDEQRKLIKL